MLASHEGDFSICGARAKREMLRAHGPPELDSVRAACLYHKRCSSHYPHALGTRQWG